MDIMKTGAQLLQSSLGGNIEMGKITSALSGLLGGSDFNIGSLVSKIQGNAGLASMATSWLGDGDNSAMSGSQVMDIFGKDKVSEFASELNIDEAAASNGLADMLPQLIDKASSGGSMLKSAMGNAGGAGGIMGMAGKLFG